jgi:integrase
MSLYRRKDSPFYWSKLFVDGVPHSFSTGARTKVEALRAEREKASELEHKAKLEGKYSLATMATKFVAWKEASGRSPDTVSKIEEHLGVHILPFFGAERDVRTIDQSGLEDFKAARMKEVGGGTVGKQLSTIRQLLKYCAEIHHIIESVPTVRNPSSRYEPKYRLLTDDELDRFLGALTALRNFEALTYLLLLANSGMRPGEPRKLTWEMIDFTVGKIHLPGRITKNRRPRSLDLNDGARAALNAMRRGDLAVGRIFEQKDHRTAIKRALTAAGVTGRLRPHDLRHTFASRLHRNGVEPVVIRDTLGHATWAMMNHYAHSFEAQRKSAMDGASALPSNVAASVALGRHRTSPTATKRPLMKVVD